MRKVRKNSHLLSLAFLRLRVSLPQHRLSEAPLSCASVCPQARPTAFTWGWTQPRPSGPPLSAFLQVKIFVPAPSFSEVHSAFSDLPQGGSVSELQLAVPIRMGMAIIAGLFRWRMQPRRGCIAVAMGANPWVLRRYKEPP